VEDILALVLIFGGGAVVAISFSPVGRAVAERIRGRTRGGADTDSAVLEELDRLRTDVGELQERMDFTERMLAQAREKPLLPGGE
jgi:hypothetical protein